MAEGMALGIDLDQEIGVLPICEPGLPAGISRPDVSATLTTIALNDSSSRWLETRTRLPASKGPPSSLVQFRTVSEDDAFVTHDPRQTKLTDFGRLR